MKSRFTALLALASCAVLVGVSLPAQAATRAFRLGIVEFRQFSEQKSCPSIDQASDIAAGSGAPASSRLPQFSLERFKHGDCVLIKFIADGGGSTVNGQAPVLDPAPTFELRFTGPDGREITKVPAALLVGTTQYYGAFVNIASDWPAGETGVEARPTSSGDIGIGRFRMTVNALGTRILLEKPFYKPGEDLVVRGVTWEDFQRVRAVRVISTYPEDPTLIDNVPATGTVTLTRANGSKITKAFTSGSNAATGDKGYFSVTFTPAEYGNVAAGPQDDFVRALNITAAGTYSDPVTGEWKTASSDEGARAIVQFASTPTRTQLKAKFTSETGWVEPGQEYVHQLEYRNLAKSSANGVAISYVLSPDAVFMGSTPSPTSTNGLTYTWKIGSIAAGSDWSPARRILIRARAKTDVEDRTMVWKDLSATATMTQTGAPSINSTTHGPRVTRLDTARYGDRPFPVVLVDYADASHSASRPGWYYDELINQSRKPSSLLNLYQEMSFKQLYPHGTIPALKATDESFGASDSYTWATPDPGGVCLGVPTTIPDNPTGSVSSYTPPASTPRIVDGWYQLPGTQSYYGGDQLTFGQYAARLAGNAGLGIDGACGPTSKAAYDAASIADPDIDYNDFDTDRNGLVDFFMFIFRGLGGNGASQTSGYDNIWPHSSTLEGAFSNPNGQQGFVSHDQLRDRLERPLWWPTAGTRRNNDVKKLTTTNKGDDLKAYVRVGPYNANPEVSTTSVIAHEYGHSLGLPDFYSTSNRSTVGYWDLMSTDNSQFMSVFTRQDLGWIVPQTLANGNIRTQIRESKTDTHRIDALDIKGRPYTLQGPEVHNGDAFYIPLPQTSVQDKAASGKRVWWSGSGDDFGCPGHTLDIPVPQMKNARSGDNISLTFQSWYEIEWDYDYGFVLISTDGGKTFTGLPSRAGTTTPKDFNPNQNTCLGQYNHGISGTSAQLDFPQNLVDRSPAGDVYAKPTYIEDSYDLSAFAGEDVLLRFAYATDPGLAKRGWFIDDLKIINESRNFARYLNDDAEHQRPDFGQAGWQNFLVGSGGADRGYYLELRDRISFDYAGRGQSDRTAIDWMPGVSVWYTDEFFGYGNTGQATNLVPRQTPLDARPTAKDVTPDLADAAFYPIAGLDTFVDKDRTENYQDLSADDGAWHLKADCFSMKVHGVQGLGKPGATADIALTANPKRCRNIGAAARVLGVKKTTPKPGGSGAPLPATGAEGIGLGIASIAVAGALGLRGRRIARR